jgi:hypothetical protein
MDEYSQKLGDYADWRNSANQNDPKERGEIGDREIGEKLDTLCPVNSKENNS